jgi:predicted RNA-binding protein with RPS1 domain
MPSKQLKLSIRKETFERLEQARKKSGRRTVTKIAAEVVDEFLELWVEAEATRAKKVAKQHAKFLRRLDAQTK